MLKASHLVTVPAMVVEGYHLPVVAVLKAITVEVVVILPGASGQGADCRHAQGFAPGDCPGHGGRWLSPAGGGSAMFKAITVEVVVILPGAGDRGGDPVHLPVVTVPAMAVDGCHLPVIEVVSVASG